MQLYSVGRAAWWKRKCARRCKAFSSAARRLTVLRSRSLCAAIPSPLQSLLQSPLPALLLPGTYILLKRLMLRLLSVDQSVPPVPSKHHTPPPTQDTRNASGDLPPRGRLAAWDICGWVVDEMSQRTAFPQTRDLELTDNHLPSSRRRFQTSR